MIHHRPMVTLGRSPSVIELRQYTLHAGRRDDLIELFDSTFVESQEDVGIDVIGEFRDLDDSDRFVWLRGFADIEATSPRVGRLLPGAGVEGAPRRRERHHGGLGRRPAPPAGRAGAGFTLPPVPRTVRPSRGSSAALVMGVVLYLEGRARQHEVRLFFEQVLGPRLVADGGSVLSYLGDGAGREQLPSAAGPGGRGGLRVVRRLP